MSWLRSVMHQRCKVATAKSRAARTDSTSAPSVRVATRGKLLSLVRPAISAASVSQRLPVMPSSWAG
jgi:hypothetical protein